APGASGPDALDGDRSGAYENAGNASVTPEPRPSGQADPDVSVEVVSVSGAGKKGAGQLTIGAATEGDTTLITLRASGSGPVHWSATTRQPWLYLSRSSGTLAPGEALTVRVYVDHLREPAGHWRARVAVAPAGAVVTITGYGRARTTPPPTSAPPSSTPPASPTPPPTTDPPTSEPPPSESPSPDPPDPETSPPPTPTPPPTEVDPSVPEAD
ncbi:hypothetical protein GTW40_25480, partial [Streptomyces sp. SID4985]|nr:hypothetical protein [Streptomyces sp. SID4985]